MKPLELDEVDPDDTRTALGGKCRGLAVLRRHGFRVPATWVLPAGPSPADLGGADLGGLAGPGSWAVRSSAAVEDGPGHSFAGLFRTELGVPFDGLPGAIARVAGSGAAERVRAYQARAGLAVRDVEVAVVLQRYEPPRAAGVWIGRTPDAGRLEWASGEAEECTGGSGTGPAGRACLGVQRALGGVADLEFAVLESGLTWVQYRPVTRPVPERVENAGPLTGVPASPGVVTGTVARPADPYDPSWRPGSVLVVADTGPDWVPLMAEAAAMVTTVGGNLCHAAIVARELGVPCVTGVRDALLRLGDGTRVTVDGGAGVVRVTGR
ncbi:PEP-utilizing enzyme [Actinomadura sp. WAC 06369]|uniref:PEP-utilizing enzyme n=1 Tax=Actinomadura sp. WAC 06369 TaxID=2203193 RepID=UPI000F7A860E|nr:PEP-utilizing enzyme [Actinomadura sp. WAC 06369]RSN70829.1 hypothetical protein DMH08_04665 [Actinomadura sp. WAC 06369]